MIVQITDKLVTVRVGDGIRQFYHGEKVAFDDHVAAELIKRGMAVEVEVPTPIKIYSKMLDEVIWLTYTTEQMDGLIQKGSTESIYTSKEIGQMKGFDEEQVKGVHMIKKAFPDSVLEDKKEETDPNDKEQGKGDPGGGVL
jgi:hypothetical protein